jgi:hypothetical protein
MTDKLERNNNERLAYAHPVFAVPLRRILRALQDLDWRPRIVYIKRTEAEQTEKVRLGYSSTMRSWHVPSTAGLLRAGRGQVQVVHGNAADIVDDRYGWDGVAANTEFRFWNDLGKLAMQNGCEWGGRWKGKKKDVAHVQMLFIESPPQSTAIG